MTSHCRPLLRHLDLSNTNYQEKNTDLTGSTVTDQSTLVAPFDHAATQRLLRKLDINLIPFLALLYL